MSDCHERGRYGVAIEIEHRGDLSVTAYHRTTPATVCHPNGTKASTGDYDLSTVFAREVDRIHRTNRLP